LANAVRTLWGGLCQIRKSFTEPDNIELIDGKYADAALRATATTDQPLATSTGGIDERGIHNLNQRPVSGR
jgi:hypothetical protein